MERNRGRERDTEKNRKHEEGLRNCGDTDSVRGLEIDGG